MATALKAAAVDGPSAESKAFRKCSSDLHKGIQDPESLAWELYSDGVVSETVVDEVSVLGLSAIQRKTKLLSAVRDAIAVDPTKFQSLLTALQNRPPLKSVAEKLETIFKTCVPSKHHLPAKKHTPDVNSRTKSLAIPKDDERPTSNTVLSHVQYSKFRLFCERPSSGDLSEKTLEVHKNQTLGEATERAYKVLELQECGVQLEQCQLVRYNQHTGTPGKPFDEPKDTPLGEVVGGSPSCLSFDLLMKIQADDKQSSITLSPHEQKSKEEELREACHLGLLEKIADLLQCVSVDAADSDGRTLLYIASWKGHSNIVEELLRREADPNRQKKDGRTPLWVASCEGHQMVVEILLGAGANPDLQEEDGWTPLKAASSNGHQMVVQLLLAAGANPDLQDKEGWTPLHSASQEGHYSVTELLLQAGADVEQETKDGRTPLYIASWKGHSNIVEELLRRQAHVNCQKDGSTPLWIASFNGHQKVVEMLLTAGANPDLQNEDGRTPLWTASFNGHQKVVEMLLTAGANPDLQNENGFAALHAACQEGHDRVAEMLLQVGASLEQKTKYGETSLLIAKHKGHERIVELLHEASRQRSVKK